MDGAQHGASIARARGASPRRLAGSASGARSRQYLKDSFRFGRQPAWTRAVRLGIIKRRLMKEHAISGLFKSLFGGRRPVPVRAKLPLYIPVVSRPDRPQDEVETLLDGLLRHAQHPLVLYMEAARLHE